MASEIVTDRLTPALAARYAATFDREPRATAPQGIHWCLCTPDAATAALGPDGHPASDGLRPPSPLPRRMWAGSEVVFHAPIPIGAAIERSSRVADIAEKAGGSGPLLFVSVAHETRADGLLAVEERQTIVYRSAAHAGTPAPPPQITPDDAGHWDWHREVRPTAPLLFRYSALTFNSHRIHYDLPYARSEGYPGLVVHGPLMASLLLDLTDRVQGSNALARFTFRAIAPAFDDAPLHLLGRIERDGVTMRVRSTDGHDHLIATATIAGDA